MQFREHAGPLKFITEPFDGTASPRLRYFPYGWTRVASVIIVDSPVGAGFYFSRNPKGYDVGDATESLHLKQFLYKVPYTTNLCDTREKNAYSFDCHCFCVHLNLKEH